MAAKRNTYQDLLVIVVGFCIIGLLIYFRAKASWAPKAIYVVYGAIGLGLIGIFSKRAAELIAKGWQMFGRGLGAVNAFILLTVIFFLLVTPLSLLQKITSGRSEENDASNWQLAESESTDFTKPW